MGPPRYQEGSSNVSNMVSHFSKMHITFPLMLGGPEVGVGTSRELAHGPEQPGSCPGAHIREPIKSLPPAAPPLDEKSAGLGCPRIYTLPFCLYFEHPGLQNCLSIGPEPAPRVYMGPPWVQTSKTGMHTLRNRECTLCGPRGSQGMAVCWRLQIKLGWMDCSVQTCDEALCRWWSSFVK